MQNPARNFKSKVNISLPPHFADYQGCHINYSYLKCRCHLGAHLIMEPLLDHNNWLIWCCWGFFLKHLADSSLQTFLSFAKFIISLFERDRYNRNSSLNSDDLGFWPRYWLESDHTGLGVVTSAHMVHTQPRAIVWTDGMTGSIIDWPQWLMTPMTITLTTVY